MKAGGFGSLGGNSPFDNFAVVRVLSGATLEVADPEGLFGPRRITIAPGGTLNAAGFEAGGFIDNDGIVNLPPGSNLPQYSGNWSGSSVGSGVLTFFINTNLNPGTNLQHAGGTFTAALNTLGIVHHSARLSRSATSRGA